MVIIIWGRAETGYLYSCLRHDVLIDGSARVRSVLVAKQEQSGKSYIQVYGVIIRGIK